MNGIAAALRRGSYCYIAGWQEASLGTEMFVVWIQRLVATTGLCCNLFCKWWVCVSFHTTHDVTGEKERNCRIDWCKT